MIINYGKRTLFDTNRLREKLSRSLRWKKSSLKESEFPGGNLPEDGRSSVEVLPNNLSTGLSGYGQYFDIIKPEIPWEVQKYISLMAITNPDISQCVKNAVSLGNTGHSIIVDAKNSSQVLDRLNEKAYEIYKISAGVDGLNNHAFKQLQVSGAYSFEPVIQDDLQGVRKVACVPVYSVRFIYEDGDYKKYQQSNQLGDLDLIPLNEDTFIFHSLEVNENLPYPIPPFLPAIKPLLIQDDFMTNLQYMAKKLGLLGLNVITVKRLPREPGESNAKYKKRNQEHLAEIAESIGVNFYKGVLVLPEDQTHTNSSITNDARGVKEIVDLVEEQVFSGAGSHPAMHGRRLSATTDAFGRVIYNMMLSSIGNSRRIVKRGLEQIYRFDLILAGLHFNLLSIQFHKDKRLRPNIDAMADRTTVRTVIDKVKVGMIKPEKGAQELGYSEWENEKLLYDQIEKENTTTKEFIFDRGTQQYKLVRSPLVDLKKDDSSDSEENQKAAVKAERKLQEWVMKYLQEVLPYFDQLQPDALEWAKDYMDEHYDEVKKDNGLFISGLIEFLEQHPQYRDIPVHDEFKKTVETRVIAAAKYYRESDLQVFGGKAPEVVFKFGVGDQKAADLLARCDHVFFSKFISNQDFGTEIREFMTEWFQRGEALYGGWTDDAVIEFISKFGYALEGDLMSQMARICNSSMGLIQVNSRFKQLFEAGFEYAVWVEFPGMCEICEPFDGALIPVAKVWKKIEREFVHAEKTETGIEYFKKINRTKEDSKKTIDEIIENKSWGKCHPNCRGTPRGKFKED